MPKLVGPTLVVTHFNGLSEIIVPSFRGSGPGSGTGSESVRDPFGTRVWDLFGTGSPAAAPARFPVAGLG